MDQRYITRFRLPERGYVDTSPVVLTAGALLQDTQLPRLVVQLKFTSVSTRIISALQVIISCFTEDGAETEGTSFCYHSLHAQRGQSFGTYTAIVLLGAEPHRFSVSLQSVSFQDGERWDAPAGGTWSYLPPFAALEAVLPDQALLQLCREKLPFAKYGYATPAGLWYCACGGVNRDGETACHRCGQWKTVVAQYASFEGLTALRQARLDEWEARRAQEEAAAQEARARAGAWKEAATEKARLLNKNLQKKPESNGQNRPAKRKNGIGLALAGACVAAVAVLAVVLLRQPQSTHGPGEVPTMPVITQDLPSAAESELDHAVNTPVSPEAEVPKRTEEIHISTPTDEARFFLNLREDEEGNCIITKEMLREFFPQMKYFEFEGVANLDSDLDAYLSNSFHMARLVGSGGTDGSDDMYSRFSARNDPHSPRYLLLFSDLTILCGYAVGVPVSVGEGVWQLEVTHCNYDFGKLYQNQAQAFAASETPPYIAPENLAACGAKRFLYAFNMHSDEGQYRNTQLYFLWNQATSPYLERHLRDIHTWDDRLPRGNSLDPQWCYYYLFDEKNDLIGYTKLSSGDYDGHYHMLFDASQDLIGYTKPSSGERHSGA